MMSPEAEKLVTAGKLSKHDGEKLSKLPVGACVQHKSWGAGRITEWDLLGDKMVVDFEDKKGHALKLSFAIGSLESLPDDHLLARRVADLPGLQAMAQDKPADLVALALRSHGGKMTLDALEAALSPRIIPAANYKSWWTAAKKALKDRRHIVVPAKRTEMLSMRAEDASHGNAMIEDLIKARDLKAKITALGRIQTDLDLFSDPGTELAPAFNEVSNTVRKAWKLHLKDALHLLLQRDELAETAKAPLPEGSLKIEELVRDARTQLAESTGNLPVALLGRLYRAFPVAFPDRAWVQECLNHLIKTGGRAVAEIATVLDANDELDQLAEYLKRAVRNRLLSTDLLIWICKERKGKSEGVFDMDLGNAILDALIHDHQAGGPKRTGRLHDAFAEDKGLIGEMVKDADDDELRLFAKRILGTLVFDDLTRRSLMGRLIKARPETQALMEESAPKQDHALLVSWESMEKRKHDLDELVKNLIPENKREIQIARAEGDLRENGGYKAARQQQAVLLRLQSKYERELRHAHGTDFANAPTDAVGIGTVVDLQDAAGGNKESYTILGAWDGDPDKQILSYLSEMAKVLIGKKIGDEVDLPGDAGASRRVRIAGIRAYNTGASGATAAVAASAAVVPSEPVVATEAVVAPELEAVEAAAESQTTGMAESASDRAMTS
jgi:transcription elongation GreA/GreB family factor